FLEKRLGGTLSQSSFANSQKSLRFRQRRVNRESVTQILGSGLIVMLKERYDTQIRIGLGVMGIERQDSSELLGCGARVIRFQIFRRLLEVIMDCCGSRACRLRSRRRERDRGKEENQ